jgi:hypothetical protein
MKTYGKVEVHHHILHVRRRRMVIFTHKMLYTLGNSFRYPPDRRLRDPGAGLDTVELTLALAGNRIPTLRPSYYTVTCTPIARQRLGKQVPANTDSW